MRALLTLLLLVPLAAAAQGGPPIRMIVPFAPGGASDTTARLVVPPLAAALGRVIVIENRPGAGGMLGAEAIARAAPDGTTLGISNTSPHGIVPLAQERPPYDSDRDFTHIVLVAETPTVLLVPAGSRFHGFADYLRAAESWRQGLSFASTGIGSLQHLQGELLARLTGARLIHVPYRGTGPALQDLVSGQVDSLLTPLAGTTGALAGGQARALAVSSAEPFAALPGVPTYAALGFPQLTATSWTGISGPRGLPPALVARINAEVNRITAAPDLARRLEAAGLYPPARPLDAAAYQRVVADFATVWGPVVKTAGIRPD
ncbi:tripartite tricarboxylate transporter substrate binding protein [Belnapia sp. T6]|uniref:Tripartite tricarboxylate transporter substrate binding protein n=1 Tax=Belnapia mucosa TaxID=2804532 RepID=A0ABS1UZS4_9PROT|nr:tripartite tricarboxylate transporter substrate binding protein [Belnapia mucosa]MBL6454910.1 tripartite tricarboxylate transporter substrate binding protein [Belnapia mucosa]